MAAFPTLTPSSRTWTPGEYPHSVYSAWSGVENRVRQSNAMLSSTLRLAFVGITEAQMLSILSHYQGELGTYTSFSLPSAIFGGTADATDYTLTGYSWRYAEAPSVEDLPCGGHNVELTLESVPPEGAGLSGLDATVSVTISPGAVAASNGITQSVTVTLNAGAASGA
jgi:hypothetical protein